MSKFRLRNPEDREILFRLVITAGETVERFGVYLESHRRDSVIFFWIEICMSDVKFVARVLEG